MALSFTSALASVTRTFYKVYMRATGSAIVSGNYDTLSNWTTFLGLFQHVGYCEDKAVTYTETPNTVDIEYGEKHPHSYNGMVDIKFLQNAEADFDAVDAMIAENVDMLLVDDVNHVGWYFHNKRFKAETHLISGGVSFFNLQLNQVAGEVSSTYATCYLYFDIPTV